MLGWRCRASSMGGQDLLLLRLLPGHGRRRKPLLVAFLILTVFVLLLRPVVADEYTGYCRWVSQDDTLTNYEGVHEAYVSFDNTDQTAGWLSLYVDMSAGGDPSTREVYLCQSEYATVVQTYPNGSSPVSIPQSKVSVTYHSMSLCVSKAFNFMKDAGLIQRDTADLTYLLIALNETWFVTGPDSATNRLPLYTAGNHIERCSKNRDFATRPISGVYCGVTYNLNASNADESQLGALGEGLFVTDYAPVIQYHPSIYLGSFSFVVGTFWGPMNLTSFDTPGLLETSPRNNPLTYNIDTRGNISSVLYYDQISVYVRTSLLDKVGDAQSIAVSYQNRYTMQLSADRLSCPEMYGRITDIVELGGVDGPNPGILPTVTEDKWKNAQGLVIGCIAALIMVIFGVWAIRVDRQHKKEFKKRTALVIPS